MRKIKAFIYVFKKSCTSPIYYRDLIRTNVGFSIKYLLFLIFFISLIFSIRLGFTIPNLKNTLDNVLLNVSKSVPDDFVLKIKDGKWELNKPDPFYIPIPEEMKRYESKEDINTGIENSVVFYRNGVIEDLENMKTLVLVNDVNVIYRDTEGIRAYPVENMPDSEINKEGISKYIDNAKIYVTVFLIAIVPVALIISFILISIYCLFYFPAVSLLFLFIATIVKNKISYKESFQITAHTSTIPLILYVLYVLSGINIGYFMLLVLFLNLLISVYVLKKSIGIENKTE